MAVEIIAAADQRETAQSIGRSSGIKATCQAAAAVGGTVRISAVHGGAL